ncbi:MAG: hypothetical protein ABIE22_04765 [archaeon]
MIEELVKGDNNTLSGICIWSVVRAEELKDPNLPRDYMKKYELCGGYNSSCLKYVSRSPKS